MGRDTVSARVSCIILSVLSALLIVASLFGIITSGLMKSNSFLSSSMIKLDSEFISMVNDELLKECNDMPVPAEAFASALDKETMDSLLTQAAGKIILCYDLDFSDNRELYECFYSGIEKYSNDNGIKASGDDLNRSASLGVKITNGALKNGVSRQIMLFSMIFGKDFAMGFVYCAAGAIACLIIINLVNKRRHKKYTYYAFALNASGLIFIFGYILASAKNYVGNFSFCKNVCFNAAIQNALNSVFKIFPIIGVVFLALGMFILVSNYFYYKRRTREMNETDELNNQMKQEFIEHYSKKHR